MFVVLLKGGLSLVLDADSLQPGSAYLGLFKETKLVAILPLDSCLAIYEQGQLSMT